MYNIKYRSFSFSLLYYGENKSTHKLWNNLHNINMYLCFFFFFAVLKHDPGHHSKSFNAHEPIISHPRFPDERAITMSIRLF